MPDKVHVHIVDIQITDANFRTGSNAVSRLGAHCNNPWAGVFKVDLGVTSMNVVMGNAVPPSQFDKVLQSRDSDLEPKDISHDSI